MQGFANNGAMKVSYVGQDFMVLVLFPFLVLHFETVIANFNFYKFYYFTEPGFLKDAERTEDRGRQWVYL